MSAGILPMPPFNWQQRIWQDFCRQVENRQLPHAFLIAGQEGVGAEGLALAMGQYLLCASPLDQIACGKCRACQLMNAGSHPDLLMITPEDEGKAIKVDQVREISTFVGKTAQQGGRKIIILDPAEAMNVNASNALLKNLEEPAGDTVFLLVSRQSSQLLPTIRSRCAKIVLPLPSSEESLAWLDVHKVDNAEEVLECALGAPLLAKRWSDEGLLEKRRAMVVALVDVAESRLEPMAMAKKWGDDPSSLLQVMLHAMDALLAENLSKRPVPQFLTPLFESIGHFPSTLLFRFRDRLLEKKLQLQGPSNLNLPLFTEELLLDWHAVTRAGQRRQ